MTERPLDEIAAAWIANQESWWAWEVVDDACRDDPERGWQHVLAILTAAKSPLIIERLGAGPLEDLLAKHGDTLIERVEDLAQRNMKFRECLTNTWQNAMSMDIWTRVCRATNRDPSNPQGDSSPAEAAKESPKFEVGHVYFSVCYAEPDLRHPIIHSYKYLGESAMTPALFRFKLLGADGTDVLTEADVESFVDAVGLARLVAQWWQENPDLSGC